MPIIHVDQCGTSLVGGLEPCFFFKYFPYYMGIILPTDEFIFFKMIKTTNQISFKTRTTCHETWEHINADFADYLQS